MRVLGLLAILATSLVYANDVLTNVPMWTGIGSCCWGSGGSEAPTFGQIITVPTDGNDVLASFTFYVEPTGPTPLNFQAYVQSWNGFETTGTPVYTSDSTTTIYPGGNIFSAYTFDPNVALTPGATYALYFSTLGMTSSLDAYGFGIVSGDGSLMDYQDFASPGSGSISDLDSNSPTSWSVSSDLATVFSADFTSAPVPEPASIGLMFAGLAALLYRARRRGHGRLNTWIVR